MSCDAGELGGERRGLGLVGRGGRHWEWVTAKSRLVCVMLPTWTWRIAGVGFLSHNQSLHSALALSD